MIAFVMPTRNRPDRLAGTLEALGGLDLGTDARRGAEVVVVDNASDRLVSAPGRLANGLRVRIVHLDHNAGAAARNVGVERADDACDWIVMLDDDSHPVESVEPFAQTIERLGAQPDHIGAVMADIHLPAHGRRESGGLPEVPIGCGVAYRRSVFQALGGYDASFGYYVEEYDLAAKILGEGYSLAFDAAFRVDHHKVDAGRDMDLILERLVRNNGWVMQRYAPDAVRRSMVREQRRRYRQIAEKEHALVGYRRGLDELRRTCGGQARRPLESSAWNRFTGLAHARAALSAAWRERPFSSAALVEPGKNAWAVARALSEISLEAGVRITTVDDAEAVVIGTLSPGPMLDAAARWRDPLGPTPQVVLPWMGAWVGGEYAGLRAA